MSFPFPELHNFDRLYSRWQLYWCHNIRAWWGKTVCAGGPAPAPPGRTWPAPAVSCHCSCSSSCSCSLLSLGLMIHHLDCPDTVIRSHEDTTSRATQTSLRQEGKLRKHSLQFVFCSEMTFVACLSTVLWDKTTFWQMNQTNLVLYISASLWSSNCVEFIVMSYLQLSRSGRCLCNIYCSGQPPSCSTGPVFSLQIISSPLQHCSRTSHPGTTDTALHWASGHTDIKLHLQLGPDWGHE